MSLEEKINHYLDARLSAREVRSLEAELRESAEARALYWEIANVHAALERMHSDDVAEELSSNLVSADFGAPRRHFLWNLAPTAAAAAVVLGFFMMQQETPAPPSIVESKGYVARWEDEIYHLKPSQLTLAAGEQRELVFVNGVRVALEGPIEGELFSPERMALRDGRIGVHVPPGAEGFTVNTPAGEVVDFGTRFGLEVAGDRLRAEVFEGRIDVQVGAENFRMEGQASLEVVGRKAKGVAPGSDAAFFPSPTRFLNLEDFGRFEEVGPVAYRHPRQVGEWAGDHAVVTEARLGVLPRSGKGMLQFQSTREMPGTHPKIGSQVWKVVDLAEVTQSMGRRPETVTLTGWCNRVAGDVETDTKFMFELAGQAGSQGGFRWSPDSVLRSQSDLLTDSDPGTWQRISLSLQLPSELRFLNVMVSAQENVVNDREGDEPEFDGHFVDDVKLEFSAGLRGSRQRN